LRTAPPADGGRAPAADDVLKWLVTTFRQAPEAFDLPMRLIDRAVQDHFIDFEGRQALAARVLGLLEEDYLRGSIPDIDQLDAEQTFAKTAKLELTMKAFRTVQEGTVGSQVNVYGDLINSQLAAGDINNYSVFVEILDQAEREIEAMDDVEAPTKAEARSLIGRLRGQASTMSAEVATGAAGSLVAGVLARLVGLPLA